MPEKTEAINNLLNFMSQGLYGHNRQDSLNTNTCIKCGEPAQEFKDDISTREYAISGLCQVCQDAFFEQDDDENI